MRPQVGLVGEAPRAVGASERLLPSMRPHVTLEEPRPRKRFAADVALAGQRVRPDVHLERGQAGVTLGAEFAREALGDLVRAMKLEMLGVAGHGGEALLALGALVGLLGLLGDRRGR